MHRDEYKELLYIVNKNIPNISAKETIELFERLSNTGCSCAMVANLLVDQIYDEENFKSIFGFSILTKDKVDSNKLMVDIFSKLYGVMKVRFIEYDSYSFSSVKEATLALLNKEFTTDSEGIVALFNNGISADGILDGKLLFKSTKLKISSYVGNCTKIAKEKFGINGIKNLDELKKLCTDKNIIFEYKDLEIYEKFTGLGTENFNFWSNYYLQNYNIDFSLDKKPIIVSDFNGDYTKFMEYINQLIINGDSISISIGPNDNVYMHTNMPMTWGKISSQRYGHVMLFKKFNKNNDIVVSSYGKDYIIPKEYFDKLEYSKIKLDKNIILDEQKKSR